MEKFNKIKILAFFLFFGCVERDPVDVVPGTCSVPNTGLFNVEPMVEGQVSNIGTTSGVLNSNFVLKFKFCITDRQKFGGIRVPYSPFQIYTFHPYDSKTDTKHFLGEEIGQYRIPQDEKQRSFVSIETQTDGNGCLHWSERYKFKEPREKRWIYFERVIRNNSGGVVIPLAVNPWLDQDWTDEQKIYDLRFKDRWVEEIYNPFKMKKDPSLSNVEQCVQSRSLDSIFKHLETTGKKPVLWVDFINITTFFEHVFKPKNESADYYSKYKICKENEDNTKDDCDKVGSFLNIDINIPMNSLSTNHLHETRENPIRRGTFLVTPYVVAYKEEKHIMLHRPIEPLKATLTREQSTLQVPEFFVHIPYAFSSSPVKMVLKIEIQGKQELEPFYGIYELANEFNNLHQGERKVDIDPVKISQESSNKELEKIQEVKKIEIFKAEFNKLNEEGSYSTLRAKGKDRDHRPKLELDLKRMRFVRVDASPGQCESVVERTVVYLGEVCLRDPRRSINFSHESLTVVVQDLEPGEYVLNENESSPLLKTLDSKYVYEDKDEKGNVKYLCHGEEIGSDTFGGLSEDDEKGLKECPEKKLIDGHNTDQMGCIQFLYRLKHKVYDKQMYLPKRLIFKSDEYGYEDKKTIVLNPWEYGFLTYQDITQFQARWEKAKEQITKECTTNRTDDKCQTFQKILETAENDVNSILSSVNNFPPILRLNEFRSINMEPSYEINRTLDISTVKNIMFLLQPKIYRPDPIGTTIRTEPLILPRGYWLLRFILAKGPQEMHHGRQRIVESFAPLESFVPLIFRWMDFYKNNKGISKWYEWETYMQQSNQNRQELEIKRNAIEFFKGSEKEAKKCMAQNCFEYIEKDYISHYDTLAYSENGVLSTFVKLKFPAHQFRYMGSTNSIIFEIYPTDPRGYNYKKDETGKQTCEIDIENSKFSSYKEHALKNLPHFGLFRSSEFGNFSIVRPIDKDNISAFDKMLGSLDPPEIDKEFDKEFDKELRENVNSLDIFGKVAVENRNGNVSRKIPYDIAKLAEGIEKEFNNKKAFKNYCSDQSYIEDMLKEDFAFPDTVDEDITGNAWFKSCVCNDQYPGGRVEKFERCLLRLNFIPIFHTITDADTVASIQDRQSLCAQASLEQKMLDQYFEGDSKYSPQAKNYMDCICNKDHPKEKSLNTVLAQCFAKEDSIQYDKTLFCAQASTERKMLEPDYEGDSKYSLNYMDCVCKDKSKEPLTTVLAQCFARNEGLRFVDISSEQESSEQESCPQESSQSVKGSSFLKDLNEGVCTHAQLLQNSTQESCLSQPEKKFRYMDVGKTISSDNSYFRNKLMNMPCLEKMTPGGLEKVIADGILEKNIHEKEQVSFLHLMCHFWFHKYYKRYFDDEDMTNFYKSKLSNITRLENFAETNSKSVEASFVQNTILSPITDGEGKLIMPDNGISTDEPFPLPQHFFQAHHKINHEAGDIWDHPYITCLKNPLFFFHIEKKILIGEINDVEYKNGDVAIFNVSDSAYRESRRDWGERQTIAVDAGLDAGIPMMALSAKAGAKGTVSKDESKAESDRRAETTSNIITMARNHIEVTIDLKKYKECLLIRPKGHVFKNDNIWEYKLSTNTLRTNYDDKNNQSSIKEFETYLTYHRWPYILSGLFLCNDEKSNDAKSIEEDYYYMHQFFGGHAYEFMSRTIFHNRPYTVLLRGKQEWDKFATFVDAKLKFDIVHDKYYDAQLRSENLLLTRVRDIRTPTIQAFINTPLDLSGFYEGVYSDHQLNTHLFLQKKKKRESSLLKKTMGTLEKGRDLFDPDSDAKKISE